MKRFVVTLYTYTLNVVVLANRKQKQKKNSLDLNWENICVKSPRHIVIGKTPIKIIIKKCITISMYREIYFSSLI